MTKDFANRGRAEKAPAKKARPAGKPRPSRATPTRGKPTRGGRNSVFHGPSFSSGAIFGAIVVLLAAYLPEWMNDQPSDPAVAGESPPPSPNVPFEFPDLLKDSEIQVDTTPYQDNTAVSATQAISFRVQAASFREAKDANEMRARLILLNLSATVVTKDSPTGTWHRVVLGPFERRVDANRALTKLREQGISGVILQD